MSDPSKSIMKLQSRTALELLQWIKAQQFEFRSGFSHLSYEYVLLKYVEHCEKEDEKRDARLADCSRNNRCVACGAEGFPYCPMHDAP